MSPTVEQRHRTAQAHDAARLGAHALDQLLRRLGLDAHCRAVPVIGLAQFGDDETPRRALDQAHAEPRLQLGDAAAELGLGQAQCATRGCEATVVDNRGEVIEVVQILHAHIVP